MITESILHILTVVFKPVFNLIPQMDGLVIPDNIAGYLISIFRTVGIFIPVANLMPLFVFSIAFTGWRFGYSIIVRLRSLIGI